MSRRKEARASLESRVPISAENFFALLGVGSMDIRLPPVTIESALSVPAVWAAVAFLSRTLAALPLHAYRQTKDGPEKLSGKLEKTVHENPNPEMDSFKFRQLFWQQVFTGGRGFAWIEFNGTQVENIWPIDPRAVVIKQQGLKRVYEWENKVYPAEEVIDVPFMLKPDGIGHYSPITMGARAIQLALAMNEYGSKFFAGGGVPPLALVGPLPQGREAMARAMADIQRSIDTAKSSDKPIFPMPPGHDLKAVGFDPEKGQMTEARRMQVEEIGRVYQLPPVFLQDLSRATFSNAEQQDLHLVKHLIGQWAQAFEGELNLKLFGRFNNARYVEHNLDGLMRGDFASRMNGYAQAVQNAIRTPDEIRALENLPAKGGSADELYVQGATVPLGSNTGGQTSDPGTTGD